MVRTKVRYIIFKISPDWCKSNLRVEKSGRILIAPIIKAINSSLERLFGDMGIIEQGKGLTIINIDEKKLLGTLQCPRGGVTKVATAMSMINQGDLVSPKTKRPFEVLHISGTLKQTYRYMLAEMSMNNGR